MLSARLITLTIYLVISLLKQDLKRIAYFTKVKMTLEVTVQSTI